MSGNIFGDDWGSGMAGTGIQRMEVRDTAEHPIMNRTTPINKTYPAQNVNSVEDENRMLKNHAQ